MLDGRWRATVERGLEPVGQGLHRAGISADGLTLIGLVFAIGTALVIADGHLLLGMFGVILTGLPDILDGSVARQSGRAGPRGAFFDSVCDRVADAALFIGVAWYLSETGSPHNAVLAMTVLALSMLITYERARAESLGFQARGGLMERAERLVLLGVGLAFDVLVPMLWVMLVLTAFTAVQRFVKVWRQATPARVRAAAVTTAAVLTSRTQVGSRSGGRRIARRPSVPPARARRPAAADLTPLRAVSILPARTSYVAYRAGEVVARVVPERIGAPAAHLLAQLAPPVMASRRAQVERNLRRIHGADYGGTALRRDVAATFDSYGRYFYELFRLSTYTPAWIEEHFHCDGIEHVHAAVAEGRGAVLALPHLGNWDFAGAWLAQQPGLTVTVVAEVVEPPELFDWFVETRARLGMRVIPLSPTAGTDVLRAVDANEVVCLLSDRDLTGDGIAVEFFGERTTLPAGPALTALRGDTPLMPVGCYFLADGRHRAHIRPPLAVARNGRLRDDLGRVTQDLTRSFEDLIRVEPTHWHLLQPNWPSDRPSDIPAASVGMG